MSLNRRGGSQRYILNISLAAFALVCTLSRNPDGLLRVGGFVIPPSSLAVVHPLLALQWRVDGVAGRNMKRQRRLCLFSTNADDTHESESSFTAGPERSQMVDFISKYLQQYNNNVDADLPPSAKTATNKDDSAFKADYYTHLLAIPVDNCHELLLELESVQRAILYHCPMLVHACIAPAITRLPLLYVQAPAGSRATTILHQIVQHVVETEINLPAEANSSNETGVQRDDGTPDLTSANIDGIRPLVIAFQGLEITGIGNQILSTVAQSKNTGTRRLQRLVLALRTRIDSQTGWSTCLPNDPKADDPSSFRPRIPFMRLPDDWDERLKSEYDCDPEDCFLTSDQGGNGISPILWGQWMDDKFGDEVRMREVAVYSRREGSFSNEEQAFYLPSLSVKLPDGNADLLKHEAVYQEYQEQRIAEAEEAMVKRANSGGHSQLAKTGISSEHFVTTNAKERMDSKYSLSGTESVSRKETTFGGTYAADTNSTSILLSNESELIKTEFSGTATSTDEQRQAQADQDVLDSWTTKRISSAIQSRVREKAERRQPKPKEKPSPEDNMIFKKYKNGTLVPEQSTVDAPKDRAPFPSREQCMGFWRVVTSPTGFPVEENSMSQSDNLILRVDGTTAGGPILDKETRQKASGGTWRFTGDTPESAQLRIRLVIPPAKDRILVMEGKLQLLSLSSDLTMTSSTFGIPLLEQRASRTNAEIDDILFCGGDVWIEDAVTGANRDPIGFFSIAKLNLPTDPTQYTITVPKSVRNQD